MEYNNSKMLEVNRLFMEENDTEALKKLYEITGDTLINILINWREEYETLVDDYMNYVGSMYNDVMEYVWDKYQLSTITEKLQDDNEFEH